MARNWLAILEELFDGVYVPPSERASAPTLTRSDIRRQWDPEFGKENIHVPLDSEGLTRSEAREQWDPEFGKGFRDEGSRIESINRATDFKRRRNMFELTPEEQDKIIMTPLEQEMYW